MVTNGNNRHKLKQLINKINIAIGTKDNVNFKNIQKIYFKNIIYLPIKLLQHIYPLRRTCIYDILGQLFS